ncbi:hypothetical protein, partial [Halocynthiibacter styelae]
MTSDLFNVGSGAALSRFVSSKWIKPTFLRRAASTLGGMFAVGLFVASAQAQVASPVFGHPPSVCRSGQATYADFSGSGIGGSGMFPANPGFTSGPSFTYQTTGPIFSSGSRIATSETWSSPSESNISSVFGFPGSEESLNIRMVGGAQGTAIDASQIVRLVYDFATPTEANELAFAVTDVELEQVRFRARDENGNPVSAATIASWFVETFDANTSNAGANYPSWDPAEPAIIGSSALQTTWHNTRIGGGSDQEASGAWFQPTIALSQLTLEMASLVPGQPSIHSYLAHCQYPVPVAENDSVKGIDGDLGASAVMNIYDNNGVATDKFGGLDIASGDVNLTIEAVATPLPGATNSNVPVLNVATGNIDVPAGTPAGTYTIDYKICGPVYTEYCDTATATIVVSSITAAPETFASIDSASGGTTTSVLASDTLNGQTVDATDVNITVGAATGGLTLNANNEIVVPAGTPAGTYTLAYTICEKANPTICSDTTETVEVSAPTEVVPTDDSETIDRSAADTGATDVINLFDGDSVNGDPASPSNATVLPVDPSTVPAELTVNPDGSVDVKPGTAPGIYEFDYELCSLDTVPVCETATATITVTPEIEAAPESFADFPQAGGDTTSILASDTLNGA